MAMRSGESSAWQAHDMCMYLLYCTLLSEVMSSRGNRSVTNGSAGWENSLLKLRFVQQTMTVAVEGIKTSPSRGRSGRSSQPHPKQAGYSSGLCSLAGRHTDRSSQLLGQVRAASSHLTRWTSQMLLRHVAQYDDTR